MSNGPTSNGPISNGFELELPGREVIHGTVDRANRPGKRPTVVLCHGFKGFQEWCFFPYVAELLAARGFTAVRFNFRGSGMRPGDEIVTDPEAFRRATFSRDLEDLHWLLEKLPELDPEHIDDQRVGLFGHSRGGGSSIIAATEGEVSALVTWAAVSTFDRLPADEVATWRETGTYRIVNARTGQELALGLPILEDVETNAERLDIRAAAARLEVPWLAVHGAEDETVPVSEGRLLADLAGPGAEYLEIPEAGHTFDVSHPLSHPSRALIQALNATQAWFRRHLG